jgi:2-haloacid dehalogenase
MREVTPPTSVVFDLGGVLIDWDPRHLYRQLFDDPDEMESFLAEVTTAEWNGHQDAGRPWADAIEILIAEHPERRELIEAFHRRWPEMLAGEIPGTVDVLADLRAAGVRLLALSNWSAEMFPVALERFDFLGWFEGIVISGEVGVNKPDRRIFEHLVQRFGIEPEAAVFVDDSPANIDAATDLGFRAIRFTDATALRLVLVRLGLLPDVRVAPPGENSAQL